MSWQLTANDSLADEQDLQPHIATLSVSFSAVTQTVQPSPIAVTTVPAGRYIRLIALVDEPVANYVQLSWTIDGDSDRTEELFPGVLNQSDQNGVWQQPTPSNTFRFGLAADGATNLPIIQHYYVGIINCAPVAIDESGESYCPYPEEKSIPAERTPYPATIIFQ